MDGCSTKLLKDSAQKRYWSKGSFTINVQDMIYGMNEGHIPGYYW